MSKRSKLKKPDRVAHQHSDPASEAKNITSSPKDTSPQVYQRDKINWGIGIRERNDLTARQKEIIDLILDKKTKVIFISGPAGTSKTWLAVYCGLHLLNQRRVSHITFVRTIIESATRSMGALPGEVSDKIEPYLMPLMDKMDEMISAQDTKRLMAEKRVVATPVNFLRGASLNAQYIVAEEAQNYTQKELVTVLTRIGKYSKLILIGDPDQSDINGQSGFMPLFDWFNDELSRNEGIRCVSLTKQDIVRSGIIRYIVERIEQYREMKSKS